MYLDSSLDSVVNNFLFHVPYLMYSFISDSLYISNAVSQFVQIFMLFPISDSVKNQILNSATYKVLNQMILSFMYSGISDSVSYQILNITIICSCISPSVSRFYFNYFNTNSFVLWKKKISGSTNYSKLNHKYLIFDFDAHLVIS